MKKSKKLLLFLTSIQLFSCSISIPSNLVVTSDVGNTNTIVITSNISGNNSFTSSLNNTQTTNGPKHTQDISFTSSNNQNSTNNSIVDLFSNTQSTSKNTTTITSTTTRPNPTTTTTTNNISTSLNNEVTQYYASINMNQTGKSLFDALSKLISSPFTSVSYDGLWEAFKDTDKRSDGKVWDMYSDTNYTFGTDQAGNYKKEGDVYNREHSVPKSWFSEAKPAYSDLFHLYPTDGYVNGIRSNYPFGEVATAEYTSKNGCKRGDSSHSGYSGRVFEPIDEYKGDFARTYFYFATRYSSLNASNSEGSSTFIGTSYPKLTSYAQDLFKKWDKLDPISEK